MAEPNSSLQFASLYVGDLHPDCGESLLYEAFSQAGNVASCRVCRDSATRRSLGYAYVNYYSVQDAEKALQTLNYMSIKGKPCRVMWSQRDPDKRKNTNSNLFIKGLDPSVDNKALHDTFSVFGQILSCKVSTNNAGKSRGYGFVHYETEEAAKEAIAKVNGMMIAGSTVFVGPFIKRDERDDVAAESFTNLYVKNMPEDWDDEKITTVFGEFGEVASSVLLKTDDGKRFALVNFQSPDAAKAAVDALHLKDMRAPEEKAKMEAEEGDEKEAKEEKEDAKVESKEPPSYLLYVQRAQSRAERKAALEEERRRRNQAKGESKGKSGIRICIRNLAEEVTADQLRELFEPFGELSAVILKCDEETQKHRGVGFVVIGTAEEAQKAINELNGQEVAGKAMNVALSERRRRGERADGEAEKGRPKGEGKGKGKGKGKKGIQAQPQPMPFPGAVGMLGPNMRPMMPMRPPMAGFPGLPGMPMPMPMPMPGAMGSGPRGMPLLPQGMPPFPLARPHAPQMAAPMPMVNPAQQPVNKEALERMPPQQQKQQLGERLYAHNFRLHPELAGKLTGMMLELPNSEILSLLESDEKLKMKIQEAVKVLDKQKS